ncbi:MAG: transcription antitermination factor NusB [bacterium]
MKSRRKARELAMQVLYRKEMGVQAEKEILYELFSSNFYSKEIQEFVRALVEKTLTNIREIDRLISNNAKNWKIARMATIDKNILRLAICELLYFSEIPPKASIDEAIELAKKYSTPESGKFVNGILDSIMKTYRKEN